MKFVWYTYFQTNVNPSTISVTLFGQVVVIIIYYIFGHLIDKFSIENYLLFLKILLPISDHKEEFTTWKTNHFSSIRCYSQIAHAIIQSWAIRDLSFLINKLSFFPTKKNLSCDWWHGNKYLKHCPVKKPLVLAEQSFSWTFPTYWIVYSSITTSKWQVG